jgi:hypothetical protein
LIYVWEAYIAMKRPQVDLTYTEIDAYNRLTKERLNGRDVVLLMKLDKLYRAEHGG